MTNEEMYAEEIVLPKGFFLQIIYAWICEVKCKIFYLFCDPELWRQIFFNTILNYR